MRIPPNLAKDGATDQADFVILRLMASSDRLGLKSQNVRRFKGYRLVRLSSTQVEKVNLIWIKKVGGLLSSAVRNQMNPFGRISVCGSISAYNESSVPTAPISEPDFVFKQLKMEGFLVHRWQHRWMEGNYL
jgi:hypothetical protein